MFVFVWIFWDTIRFFRLAVNQMECFFGTLERACFFYLCSSVFVKMFFYCFSLFLRVVYLLAFFPFFDLKLVLLGVVFALEKLNVYMYYYIERCYCVSCSVLQTGRVPGTRPDPGPVFYLGFIFRVGGWSFRMGYYLQIFLFYNKLHKT